MKFSTSSVGRYIVNYAHDTDPVGLITNENNGNVIVMWLGSGNKSNITLPFETFKSQERAEAAWLMQ